MLKMQIDGVHDISGNMAVIAGTVLEGEVKVGDVISFECLGRRMRRQVLKMEAFRKWISHSSEAKNGGIGLWIGDIDWKHRYGVNDAVFVTSD